MRFLVGAASLAALAEAHTLFTNIYVDGENQGDGTCVREPADAKTANAPIYPLDGENQACGRQGQQAVPFVCLVRGGSTVSFEYRLWPDGAKPGSIAQNHKGPCAVYMKKMNDILRDSAAGDGWFKIWEDGYHRDTDMWCVDTLIENGGLLSVDLPRGLPPGEYLIRPELLALHLAHRGDPQFFHGCAQIFVQDGPDTELEIPAERRVSIPGYIRSDDPGLTYDIYDKDGLAYPIPGPEVFYPQSPSSSSPSLPQSVTLKQERGVIPADCLLRNANWCARPVGAYAGEEACWRGVEACYNQGQRCWDGVPPSGHGNCQVWSDYCAGMNDECDAGRFEGPPAFGGEQVYGGGVKRVPETYGVVGTGGDHGGRGLEEEERQHVEAPKGEGGPGPVDEDREDRAELVISRDGRCGGSTGQTCKGSAFGDCCSRKGRCGRKTQHCGCGCQSGFGDCITRGR